MVGVAVKVTFTPLQTLVDAVLIVTDGLTTGNTVMLTVLEVAGLFETQSALDVMIHEYKSPLAAVEVIKVGELTPVFTPFFFH